MKGQLVKRDDRWDLYLSDGQKVASTLPGATGKLSVENCKAVESGYNLDELTADYMTLFPARANDHDRALFRGGMKDGFREGFQKALSIFRDKKFSEEDMRIAYDAGASNIDGDGDPIDDVDMDFEGIIHSAQETEWDVEIVGSGTVYKTVLDCCTNHHPKFGCTKKNGCSCISNELPQLDVDGCLFLKRNSYE